MYFIVDMSAKAGRDSDAKDTTGDEENEVEKGELDAAPSSKHEQRGAADLARIAVDHADESFAADGAAAAQRLSQVINVIIVGFY